MTGPLRRWLEADHARLEALLAKSTANPDAFDLDAFERFRVGLLRHISIEEKVLFLDAKKRRGGEPLARFDQLRIEHSAIAALMVPTPDAALAREVAAILAVHDPREEGDDGVYAEVEALAGDEAAALLERAQAVPEPPPAKHFDGRGTMRTAAEALARFAVKSRA